MSFHKGIPQSFSLLLNPTGRRVILYNHLTLLPKGNAHKLETQQASRTIKHKYKYDAHICGMSNMIPGLDYLVLVHHYKRKYLLFLSVVTGQGIYC